MNGGELAPARDPIGFILLPLRPHIFYGTTGDSPTLDGTHRSRCGVILHFGYPALDCFIQMRLVLCPRRGQLNAQIASKIRRTPARPSVMPANSTQPPPRSSMVLSLPRSRATTPVSLASSDYDSSYTVQHAA